VPREKIVLVGAGSAMFTRGLVVDLIGRGWEADLALVDTSAEALAVAEGLTRKMLEARGAPVRLSASVDRRDVLDGATAVICTIGVGGRRAWEADVFIPRKHGIFQPVGDSVMPGGTSRALRMIPAMVDIAKDVLDLAPEALFFNYGNPMTPVCRAVRKATGAPVVGLCHGVFGVAYTLADLLGVTRAELEYTAVGLNHLTWFTGVGHEGKDLMPRLREIAREQLAAAAKDPDTVQRNRFTWELLDVFGAFPAVGDRHTSEFFPQFFREGRYYGKTLGVDAFSFEDTIAQGDRIFERMREDALSRGPLAADYFEQFGGEHEQVLDIIQSLRTDNGKVYSANLPNTGQVPNLPAEAVLESPAAARDGRLEPLPQTPLATGIAGILAGRLGWCETVVDAALEGSRTKFIQALVLDGAVPSLAAATQLADELVTAHAAYLPRFSLRGDA